MDVTVAQVGHPQRGSKGLYRYIHLGLIPAGPRFGVKRELFYVFSVDARVGAGQRLLEQPVLIFAVAGQFIIVVSLFPRLQQRLCSSGYSSIFVGHLSTMTLSSHLLLSRMFRVPGPGSQAGRRRLGRFFSRHLLCFLLFWFVLGFFFPLKSGRLSACANSSMCSGEGTVVGGVRYGSIMWNW